MALRSLLVFVVAVVSLPVSAQTLRPKVRTLTPAGGQKGATVSITVAGANIGYGTQLLFERPGIMVESVTPQTPPANAKNPDGTLTAKLRIAPDAAPGQYVFRVVTPFGASEHGIFTVGEWPEAAETEPNNTRETAQKLTSPVTINARSDAGEDIDWYQFVGKPGETWVFEAGGAACFGSPMEPVLTLQDATGQEVGNSAGLVRAETRLTYLVRKAGTYYLRVRDLRYSGSSDHQYRLSAGLLPVVTSTWPLGGPVGVTTSLSVSGINLPQGSAALSMPQTGGLWETPILSRLVTLDVAPMPSVVEVEPNETVEKATRVTLPVTVDGRIGTRGDTDCFRFSATKSQVIELEVRAARLGSKLDGVLRVLAADGRELASNDDGRGKDPYLAFTAPDNGEYIAALTDLNGLGGDAWTYRLRLAPAAPDFSLTVAPDSLNVGAGDRIPVTVTATRAFGFNEEINLEGINLPPGLTLQGPLKLAPGQNEIQLFAVADANAAPAMVPLRLVGRASVGERTASALLEEYSKSPEGNLVRGTRPVPFPVTSVTAAPDIIVSLGGEKLELKAGGTAELVVKLTRKAGFTAKVPLILTGLPAGVSATPLEVPENQSEVKLTLKAEANAAVGENRVLLVGRSVVDELRFTPHAAPPFLLQVVK
ncbi:MAG: PPC domain-containing protein [Armatimonas sp.]